jgi:hypothetical protein
MRSTSIWRLLRRHRRGDPDAARQILGMFLGPAAPPIVDEHIRRFMQRIYDGEVKPDLLFGKRGRGRPPDWSNRARRSRQVMEHVLAGVSRTQAIEQVRAAHSLSDAKDIERDFAELRDAAIWGLAAEKVRRLDLRDSRKRLSMRLAEEMRRYLRGEPGEKQE